MALDNTHFGADNFSSLLARKCNIRFLGIGGVSMCSLARVAKADGHNVSGYDRAESDITRSLCDDGISVSYSECPGEIERCDLVVYTVAVSPDNAEYKAALSLKKPTVSRADFLGYIMSGFKTRLGVSGTHGKSTTTSMLAKIFTDAGYDPTVNCGAVISDLGASHREGRNRDVFVFEACEYMDAFLDFYPTTAVVLNVEADHLDYFKTMTQMRASYTAFMNKTADIDTGCAADRDANHASDTAASCTDGCVSGNAAECTADRASDHTADRDANRVSDSASGCVSGSAAGCAVVNADDENAMLAARDFTGRLVTFAVDADADYRAVNVTSERSRASFDVYRNGSLLFSVKLKVPGRHCIYDALAATAAAYENGVGASDIAASLEGFSGARRRMEFFGKTPSGADVYEDYAHHPTEISTTITGALGMGGNSVRVIFQPHTYSRTAALYRDFTEALSHADEVILADVYPARETDTLGMSSAKLAADIPNALYLPDNETIAAHVKSTSAPGDIIIVMGAGDIDKVTPLLLK